MAMTCLAFQCQNNRKIVHFLFVDKTVLKVVTIFVNVSPPVQSRQMKIRDKKSPSNGDCTFIRDMRVSARSLSAL